MSDLADVPREELLEARETYLNPNMVDMIDDELERRDGDRERSDAAKFWSDRSEAVTRLIESPDPDDDVLEAASTPEFSAHELPPEWHDPAWPRGEQIPETPRARREFAKRSWGFDESTMQRYEHWAREQPGMPSTW
jgi:hypothetical protein